MESLRHPTSFYIKIEFVNRLSSGIVVFIYTAGKLISSPGKRDMSEAAKIVMVAKTEITLGDFVFIDHFPTLPSPHKCLSPHDTVDIPHYQPHKCICPISKIDM